VVDKSILVFGLRGMNAMVLALVAAAFPISVHLSGRYFVDAAGVPFPILGMTAWSAAVNLSPTDLAAFLRDRTHKGFNPVNGNLIPHPFTSTNPPQHYTHS